MKKEKPIYKSIRKTWAIKPVTKVKESKKIYDRNNEKINKIFKSEYFFEE